MSDVKVLQKLAFELESGQTPVAWGAAGGIASLGASDMYPFLNIEKGPTINTQDDNGILSEGFTDTPTQTGVYVEKSGSINMYYRGLNKWLYWVFGFEHVVNSVVCFVVSGTVTIEPEAGARYQDGAPYTYTFVRKEVYKNNTYYVFSGSVAPTGSTLTKTMGTGDATLTVSANSDVMYEHWFELDSHERHQADYRDAEQITGWSSGYKKCRRATMAIDTTVTDILYYNAMCKKWSFKSSAGNIVSSDFDFCAYKENRGNYSSASWTPSAAFVTNDYLMLHHHLRFKVGTTEGTVVNLGVTDINFNLDIPLEVIQDTESGLYIAEPFFSGKYNLSLEAKLSRYSAETYQTYRDSWTDLIACIEAQSGYYTFNIMFDKVKIHNAGPDSDAVTKEPLKFIVCPTDGKAFTNKCQGFTSIQNSPIICMVRNDTSANSMFLN